MTINKITMAQELTVLLKRVFQLPEVNKVQIREIEIYSADEEDKIKQSVEECYHDILSDIDIGIHVTLHPNDIGDGHGYHRNPSRIGLTRDNYLGISMIEGGSLCQMYRVIMKNGIRLDISFYIKSDDKAPVYNILQVVEDDKHLKNKQEVKWDLAKADSFWFVQIQAIGKLMRGDYLIADHLANIQINETLVAQMIERDILYGTNFHRYGYREVLDYKAEDIPGCQIEGQDETYNMIANKLYSAAISYDRLVQRLNPEYMERRQILFEIWKQYEIELFGQHS